MVQEQLQSYFKGRVIYKDYTEQPNLLLSLTMGNETGVIEAHFFGRRAYFYYFMVERFDTVTVWGDPANYGIHGRSIELQEVAEAAAKLRFKAAEHNYREAEAEHSLYFSQLRAG